MSQHLVRPRRRRTELTLRVAVICCLLFAFLYNQYFPGAPNWGFWLCLAPLAWPLAEWLLERRESLSLREGKVTYCRGGATLWEAPVSSLTEVDYRRTPAGRLLGWGMLHLEARGGAAPLRVQGGANLLEFAWQVKEYGRAPQTASASAGAKAAGKSKKQERAKKK